MTQIIVSYAYTIAVYSQSEFENSFSCKINISLSILLFSTHMKFDLFDDLFLLGGEYEKLFHVYMQNSIFT